MRYAYLLSLLVAANLAWGASYVVIKLGLGGLTPFQLSLWRMLPAAALSLPVVLVLARRTPLPLRVWPALAALGCAAFVLNKLLEIVGVNLSSATNAALLLSMEPLFTLALGVLVLRERLGLRRVAALAAGAAGAWLLIARGLRWPDWSAAHVAGDLIFVAGLTLEAIYSVFGKRLLGRYPPLLMTAATIALSGLVWLPLGVADVALHGWPAFTPVTLGAAAFLALGCTLLAYWAWFHALAHLDAGLVALTLFVQPVTGALLGVWVLGEPFTAATATGGALVLAALWLALGPRRLWRRPQGERAG